MKQIFCHIQKCLGCRSCELACATVHSQSKILVKAIREKVLPKHRIHIELVDEKGSLHRVRAIAIQCRHCEDAFCAQACISGGIRKEKSTGDVIVDPQKCVGCWSCIMVCPIGAIVKNEDYNKAVKCDHCPDLETPACVAVCPTHALVYCEQDEMEEIGIGCEEELL